MKVALIQLVSGVIIDMVDVEGISDDDVIAIDNLLRKNGILDDSTELATLDTF